MIFVTHFGNSRAAKDYLSQHLSQGDYFAKDAERLAPTWEGKTAERLGLEGRAATQHAFFALCDNEHPDTRQKLTPRTKQERRAMTDLTFDVPKSVSVAALLDDRLKRAIDQAVDESMREIERDMATRVRQGGKDEDRHTGNMIWAVWSHDTTRPLEDGTVDAQEHRHVTVMNVTWDTEEKRYKAGQLGSVVRDKGFHQATYHARLADKLKALGYGIEKDGNSFRLEGISKDLCDKFSRRHQVIDKAAQEKGIESKAGRAKLAKVTRNRKGEELSTKELREEWLSRMTSEEVRAVGEARSGARPTTALTPHKAVQYAIDHTFQRESTTSERKLKAEALRFGVGSVLPDEIQRVVDTHPDLIRVTKDDQRMVTTKGVLDQEIAMLKFARDGHGKFRPMGDLKHLPEGLTAEQGAAAAHILQSRGRVVGIRGAAGAGKTYTMKATADALEASGQCVAVFAPSAQASRGVLKNEGFENAQTLEMLLSNEQMQAKTKGAVLWVDEAGLVSSRDMGRLFDLAQRNGNRVVLSGDYLQHGSVDAGDAFRLLESEAGVRYARLQKIQRQKPVAYRTVVEEAATGTKQGVQKAFSMLDKMGHVIEAGDERHALLVSDYMQAVNDRKSALIIAPTHREGDALTREIRERLKADGLLGTREHTVVTRKATGWTEAQKGDARNYEQGMVIEFHQNAQGGFRKGEKAVVAGVANGKVEVVRQDGSLAALAVESLSQSGKSKLGKASKGFFEAYRTEEIGIAKGERLRITKNDGNLKVNNGDIVTVDSFTKDGYLRLTDGKLIPRAHGHIAPGYVDTSYASQGKTVDRVFIAAGNESMPAANSQQWYVSISRGKESAKVYVDDKREIREAIARSGQRLSAVELVKPESEAPLPQAQILPFRARLNKALDRKRVTRYLKDRAESFRQRWRSREVRHA